MPVTPDEVRHVAELARLRLEPEEEARMLAQLSRILAYMDQLQELDTAGVEPLAHPFAEASTPLRPDVSRPGLHVEEALRNAPDRHGPFFKVPRMIEESEHA